jgi:SM-20-related protein
VDVLGTPLVKGGSTNQDLFTWTHVSGFFDRSVVQQLAQEFPNDGFRVAGTSSKHFYVRSLVVDGGMPSSARGLPAVWRSIGYLISSMPYRERLGDLVGRDLAGLRLDASLCRYPPGCSLMPHTDRDIRDTTHIIYFNRNWRREWGGMLRILRSACLDDVIEEILPELHTSVVMVRSEHSWHAVSTVAEAVTQERLSLLVHASRADAK